MKAPPTKRRRGGQHGLSVADKLREYSEIDHETGCRNWTRHLSHNGYGECGIGGGAHRPAHRLAWELAHGPIPDGLQIDHLCRNRRCINVDHLEVVTRKENIARGNAPHILNAKKTHCKHGHPFDNANTVVREHRGILRRVCLACEIPAARRRAAAFKQRAKARAAK